MEPEQGAPVPSDGMYASHTEWPDVERDHAAVITYLDGYVGELMALIKKLGIDSNTVGAHPPHTSHNRLLYRYSCHHAKNT
jgi:hypothetical protein